MNIPHEQISLIGNKKIFSKKEILKMLETRQSPDIIAQICKREDFSARKAISLANTYPREKIIISVISRNDVSYKQAVVLIMRLGLYYRPLPWCILISKLSTPLDIAIKQCVWANQISIWKELIGRKDISPSKLLNAILELKNYSDILNSIECILNDCGENIITKYFSRCSLKRLDYYIAKTKHHCLLKIILKRKGVPAQKLIEYADIVNEIYCYRILYQKKEVIDYILTLPKDDAIKHATKVPSENLLCRIIENYKYDADTLIDFMCSTKESFWIPVIGRIEFGSIFRHKKFSEMFDYARKLNNNHFWGYISRIGGNENLILKFKEIQKDEALEIAIKIKSPLLTECVYSRNDIILDDVLSAFNNLSDECFPFLLKLLEKIEGGMAFVLKGQIDDVLKKLNNPLQKEYPLMEVILKRKDLSPKWKIEYAKMVDTFLVWNIVLDSSDVKKYLKTPA